MVNNNVHNFHIPVMGTGFTIDTPLKVAHFGISSVISLVDDILMEKMRGHYCRKYNRVFEPIDDKQEDFRAKRITAYLNLINELVNQNFEKLKNSEPGGGSQLEKYFDLLPDSSPLKKEYLNILQSSRKEERYGKQEKLMKKLSCGSIDVNIMTKLDKANYRNKNEKLPVEFNDAQSALRGYANSKLNSSIVFSAGMNPRLYTYIEQFEDFFPDENGNFKKRIVLKVSDFRSAMIQARFLAKKGLWVSEYRIESGLNCGGHAFATNGFLLGPILEEFKLKREELVQSTFEVYKAGLLEKGIEASFAPSLTISAQGGIGEASEHDFLLKYYKIDSTGWGTPFLLVPEAVNVDNTTLSLLAKAKEKDLYLSNISPLGVPFNTVKGNTKDEEKLDLINKNRPGSSCPKKYVAINTEFSDKAMCLASREYQYLKIKEIKGKDLPIDEEVKAIDKVIEKSCICVGLGTAALLVNDLDTRQEGNGVSVCPGPNMAYFSKVVSLKEMVDHIYGKGPSLTSEHRPNMFVKELSMYVHHLKNDLNETLENISRKRLDYLNSFKENLLNGIQYYKDLFSGLLEESEKSKEKIYHQLNAFEQEIISLNIRMEASVGI
ncbi:hypothetical protein QQ008_11885 [Fulvivirgaceae bacterium BMA10]|uniref:Uncharacterized protein n=1 Tax=Splendidivirga corallicola TaxID=3051826 RepID=A0ABT8KPE8_9BACT|nr:hypothetical protein [Fulvivirgaceae bacterium BMA10]